MLGLFITVAISLMGIMGRILWTQQKRLTQIETTLEAQKEEISFIKALIIKLQNPHRNPPPAQKRPVTPAFAWRTKRYFVL